MTAVLALHFSGSALHEEHVADDSASIRRWHFHKAAMEFHPSAGSYYLMLLTDVMIAGVI